MKTILVLGIALGGAVWGKDLSVMQFAAYEWRENCVASQSFASKVESEISVKTLAQKENEAFQAAQLKELEKCTVEHKIGSLDNEENLRKALVKCSEPYEQWVETTPVRLLLKEELRELNAQLSRIKKFIRHSCLAMN